MMSNPDCTVDTRFTPEGISISMYDADGNLLDESWHTWAEVEEMKADDRSHVTFEYDRAEDPNAPPLVTDVDRVTMRTADIEVSTPIYEVAWTKGWQDADLVEMVVDPEGMPDWMEELLES